MYKAIGKRIQTFRRLNGMTQAELAEKSNISLSFLGHIERGTRVLSVSTLINIWDSLHCSADHLLGIYRSPDLSLSQALHMAAIRLEEI